MLRCLVRKSGFGDADYESVQVDARFCLSFVMPGCSVHLSVMV